jgi:hypothetical protein
MSKVLTLTGILVALTTSLATGAPGLNLGWYLVCPSLGPSDLADACDSNTNLYNLTGSARAPAGLSKVTAEELVIDIMEDSATLSPWWHLEDETATSPGGCRGINPPSNPFGSLSLTASFLGASTAMCKNYWGTSASGGQNYVPGYGLPNRARLQGVFARTEATAGPLTADVQYYVLNATLDTDHTVPDPTDPSVYVCPGCQDGVCIVFNSCKFDQPPGTPGGDIEVSTPDLRQYVRWQGGGTTVGCPQEVPTRHVTWGKVKSLYR